MSHENSKTFLSALFIILFSIGSFSFSSAQKNAILKGVVRDANSKEPIPFATIFLANTTIGTSAKEDGSFLIENIPDGKYDVIVSSVGFKKIVFSLQFSSTVYTYNFELVPEAIQLKPVVVEANEKERKRHLRSFTRYFIGTTLNAEKCRIENPDDIYFTYDTDEKILRAQADKPIVIVNNALGYKIHYLLDEFELNESKQTLRTFGIPRFENLQPENNTQSGRWLRARNKAYLGSLNHLMHSILKRSSRENNFFLSSAAESSSIEDSIFFKDGNTNKFEFTGAVRVTYTGENEEYNYRSARFSNSQISTLHFSEPSLILYENGYFENYKSVELEGYLAWSTVLAELVPLGFKIYEKKK